MPIPEKKEAEQPKTVQTKVYEALRDWIIDGTLEPGEKILDSEISKYFNVSRTPVREAMQMLAEQKLIEVYPGKASLVSQVDSVNIAQIYRMLAGFHCMALEFAFPVITERSLEEMRELNRRLSRAIDRRDLKECRRYDTAFHALIISLSANSFIADFSDILTNHVARVENIYFGSVTDSRDSVIEHESIINALEQKDLSRAKQHMYSNWMHTVDTLQKVAPELIRQP